MSMQLDKNSIDKLLLLDDNGMWAVIRLIASQSGINLPPNLPVDQLALIRRALANATDDDIATATEILGSFGKRTGG